MKPEPIDLWMDFVKNNVVKYTSPYYLQFFYPEQIMEQKGVFIPDGLWQDLYEMFGFQNWTYIYYIHNRVYRMKYSIT